MTSDTDNVIAAWIVATTLATRPVTPSTRLMDEGWLDSLQIVQLVEFLEERFSVAIDLDEMVPENFATIGAVTALVQRSPRTTL